MVQYKRCWLRFLLFTSSICECTVCDWMVGKGGEEKRCILSIISCLFWRCFLAGSEKNWKETRWWTISRPRAHFFELLLKGDTAVPGWKPSQREGGGEKWGEKAATGECWWDDVERERRGGGGVVRIVGRQRDSRWQEGRTRERKGERRWEEGQNEEGEKGRR